MEQAKSSGIVSLFPILVIFVLFYFLLIKPQQKKAKEQKTMIDNLRVGDEIVLSSGIICEVDSIPKDKDYIFARLSDKNVVRVFKDAIMDKYKEEKKDYKNKK